MIPSRTLVLSSICKGNRNFMQWGTNNYLCLGVWVVGLSLEKKDETAYFFHVHGMF